MSFLSVRDISNADLILTIIGAGLCFVGYCLRLAAHVILYTRGRNIFNFRALLIVIFLGYLGWGYWCGADPLRMNIAARVAVPVGAALAAIGMALFLYSEIYKHGVGETEAIVSSGIYAKIRHPMYFGLILLHAGFPLIFRSFSAFVSTILWAGFIAAWTHFEEKNLERRFGRRYTEYKRQTWF